MRYHLHCTYIWGLTGLQRFDVKRDRMSLQALSLQLISTIVSLECVLKDYSLAKRASPSGLRNLQFMA